MNEFEKQVKKHSSVKSLKSSNLLSHKRAGSAKVISSGKFQNEKVMMSDIIKPLNVKMKDAYQRSIKQQNEIPQPRQSKQATKMKYKYNEDRLKSGKYLKEIKEKYLSSLKQTETNANECDRNAKNYQSMTDPSQVSVQYNNFMNG